jgi:molybdopterin synthase catalytic subunit
MTVQLLATPFDPWPVLARHQQGLGQCGRYGATACFVGTLRDFNQGETVAAMTLEHYPGMTEKYLGAIRAEAMQRWPIIDALIVHRTGTVTPNDTVVLAAVWAAHRAEAFAACRYLIEELKTRAPFWKHERAGEGARWVEHNTPG